MTGLKGDEAGVEESMGDTGIELHSPHHELHLNPDQDLAHMRTLTLLGLFGRSCVHTSISDT